MVKEKDSYLEPPSETFDDVQETETPKITKEDVIPKNIEMKLSKEKKDVCRQIVKTINTYGVSQRQKLFLCELLALELEDRDAMMAFTNAIKVARQKLGEEIIADPIPRKKLIV